MPFLVFRFLIYFGITLAYVLATGAGMGIGYFIGTIGDDPGAYSVWGGFFGFGLVSAVMYFVREYLLYLVKAGHIAVLVELMEDQRRGVFLGEDHFGRVADVDRVFHVDRPALAVPPHDPAVVWDGLGRCASLHHWP